MADWARETDAHCMRREKESLFATIQNQSTIYTTVAGYQKAQVQVSVQSARGKPG